MATTVLRAVSTIHTQSRGQNAKKSRCFTTTKIMNNFIFLPSPLDDCPDMKTLFREMFLLKMGHFDILETGSHRRQKRLFVYTLCQGGSKAIYCFYWWWLPTDICVQVVTWQRQWQCPKYFTRLVNYLSLTAVHWERIPVDCYISCSFGWCKWWICVFVRGRGRFAKISIIVWNISPLFAVSFRTLCPDLILLKGSVQKLLSRNPGWM